MTKQSKAQRPPKPTGIATVSISSGGVTYREPTETEQEAAFRPYAEELGRLVYAWNRLHVHCAELFHVATGIKSRDVALAIWHTTFSDLSQRKMLRAAAGQLEDGCF